MKRGGMKQYRPDAKVFYLTVKKSDNLIALLRQNMPQIIEPEKVILSGGVWLNGKRINSTSTTITKGEHLKVYVCPNQGYHYNFNPNSIISECSDWVVVVKEPLVTIGMDRSNQYFNLMAGLNRFYGFSDLRSGVQPITRLDYRVGGLCLFSKNKKAERRLFNLMQQRRIKKRYLAVVDANNMPISRTTISNNLTFTHKASKSELGKPAKTRFILRNNNLNDVHIYSAMTKTGRRHQVRVHASSSIGPLINDEMYSKKYKGRHTTIGLIASQIQFFWNGKLMNIALTSDWEQQLLAWIKLETSS